MMYGLQDHSLLHKRSVLNVLDAQNLDQLKILLEQQKLRKEQLLQKKSELKDDTASEFKDRAAQLSAQVGKCFAQFSELKIKLREASGEKVPQKLENPSAYFQLEQLSALERSSDYLHVFEYIRSTSKKIETSLESGMMSSALDCFSRLQVIEKVHLSGTQCFSLITYCANTVNHWEKELTQKLSKDFETSLGDMGWPLRIVQSTPTSESKNKFISSASSILRLSGLLGNKQTSKDNKNSTILAEFQDPILPVMIMIKPLKKRFRFNFFGSNATSKDTKPEWYFSQVKHWIRDLVPFVKANLENLGLDMIKISCTVEFIRALSELIIAKADIQLSACLETSDNITFAKILEESVTYENEVGEVLRESVSHKSYIPPFVSTLFSRPQIMKHWLFIEKTACQQKLDEIFSSPSAWDRAIIPGPPEIVHLFLALLRFITGRFSHLPQPGQRIQFLQLLVDMIDDFRYRCLQIWKSRNEVINDLTSDVLFDYVMAGALWHIESVLEMWENLPLFESLSFFLDNIQDAEEKEAQLTGFNFSEDPKQIELDFYSTEIVSDELEELSEKRKQAVIGSPNRGLFSHVQNLYRCLGDEILNAWSNNVMSELGQSLNLYFTKKWHCLPNPLEENQELEISTEFILPIQKLTSLCRTVSSGMVYELAEQWLKRLLVNMDDIIMENLIKATKFSKGAMQQLKHDFTKGLFPIFFEYNVDTSLFLSGITCALKIWDMPLGDAMLIFDDLTDAKISNNSHDEILAETEITLQPSEVLKLLKTRTDIIC